jgi:hypothetical protein
VRRVDGQEVRDSATRLERLLADDGDGTAKVRRLRNEGARFNIGSVGPNFTDPVLALQFLAPAMQPRFAG